MELIVSVLSGTRTLHDMYSINYVANTKCSYHALMRFVSKCKHSWQQLMLLVVRSAFSIIRSLNNSDLVYTLCIDNTVIERARSKRLDVFCRTYNHVIGKMVKVYTNLFITRTDGFTSIPVASELLSTSKDKNVLIAFDKSVDNRCSDGRRSADEKTRKTKLLSDAVKAFLTKKLKLSTFLWTPGSFLMI